jgi:hypothetical protein
MRTLIIGLTTLTLFSAQPDWKIMYFPEERVSPVAASDAIMPGAVATMSSLRTKFANQCWNFPNESFGNKFYRASGVFGTNKQASFALVGRLCQDRGNLENEIYAALFFEKSVYKNYFLFKKSYPSGITSLHEVFGMQDINMNKRDELAVLLDDGDGCCGVKKLYVFEISKSKYECSGSFLVSELDSSEQKTVKKLYVKKLKKPIFKADMEKIDLSNNQSVQYQSSIKFENCREEIIILH